MDPRAARRAALLAEQARLFAALGAVLTELARLEAEDLAAPPKPAKPPRRVQPLRAVIDPSIELTEVDAARASKALKRYRR